MGIVKNSKKTEKNGRICNKTRVEISRSDQEIINELDYEYKKAHKPYNKWERHWDEA